MLRAMITQNLNRVSEVPTIDLWNALIRKAVNDGYFHKTVSLYRQMKQNGVKPNKLTFPFVAKACAKLLDIRQSLIIHAHILKSPFSCNAFVGTAVIDMYVKCDYLECACNVFDKMPNRDVALWNVMLLGFAQSGSVDRFFYLFRQMRHEGMPPDSVSIIGLTQTVAELENAYLVKAVHSVSFRFGMQDDVSLVNTLVSAYAKCQDFVSADGAFAGLDSDTRTIVSWNSLIAGYARFGNSGEVVILYKGMYSDGLRPDLSTFLSLLSSCVQPEALLYGKLIHSHVIQLGCDSEIRLINTAIAMYSKCGDTGCARQLFESMSWRTCVSWTAMISGYADKGDLDEALALFSGMEAAGEKPDMVTVVSLLSGCGQTGSLELGRWLENYALSNGFGDCVRVSNALIDMYMKCGCINNAIILFYSMPQKTIVSFTTMISGCALNGEIVEALNIFFRMVKLGVNPNHITFLAILQACNHAGFLEKGLEFFDLMTKEYHIDPGLEHYSCIIDLLGRCGKVKEALKLVKKMPAKPDAGVWGGLLHACKIHHNVEIGEYAAYHLFELEPETAVSYVEMANTYALAGRWDGVSRVRGLMKCKGVRKSPGQSHIEVNRKNHRFSVEERFHPECSRIYEILSVLVLHLKEDIYLPYQEGFLDPEMGLE